MVRTEVTVIKDFLAKIKNAQVMPKIYYGLHMVEGVAEYHSKEHNDGKPYRILVSEKAIKEMDPTFAGLPVYVNHVDDVDPERNVEDADGYVIESFFNKPDGKHWSKFIVITDDGHDAINKGWQLSNAYEISQNGPGGKWHGVEYLHEVLAGSYEHMAIVQKPRYTESIILTPEKFKEYNLKLEGELLKLANSIDNKNKKTKTKGDTSMLNFFKKEKVENSDELAEMSVVLPKSKKAVTLTSIINDADQKEVDKDKEKMANGDEMVEIGDKKMSVNDMIEGYNNMAAYKKKNEEEEEKRKKNMIEEADHKIMENMSDEDKEKFKNMDDDDKKNYRNMVEEKKKKANMGDHDKVMENMGDDEKEKFKNMGDHEKDEYVKNLKKKKNTIFNELASAHIENSNNVEVLEIGTDQIARGKKNYGS